MDLKELTGRPSLRHPWELARATFFLDVLAQRGLPRTPGKVLDVGSGDGFFAEQLVVRAAGPLSVSCVDMNYADHQLGSRKVGTNGSAGELRFSRHEPDGRFELLLLMDVVEHVPDDVAFVAGVVERRLSPGGFALVSVPAFESLYTRNDVALGHYRRYRAPELRGVLERSGLSVVTAGSVFQALVPVRAVEKVAEVVRGVRSKPGQVGFGSSSEGVGLGAWRGGPRLTSTVTRALEVSNALFASSPWGLPGLSVWALCRKP